MRNESSEAINSMRAPQIENLIRAFIEATGALPEECVLVEQRDYTTNTLKWWVERRVARMSLTMPEVTLQT